ncbi:hypothetical protein KGF54_001619 [Candida jiufengensis]|uniref:uncharacterized protein n=1 Tax=Candida jiufengensis TaxID=497108 RepID=UPI002224A02F|nr:uncharacterized protein KGF54_001619 [Candida jiufengensis]KAI5955058.1 hypothetical protein KGF54_001619 [Candida jiufengensis]
MFKFNAIDDSRPKLPDSIKIDDITSGKIDPKLIYEEIERLKAETNILRNDMSSFLRALTVIPKDHSQKEFYQNIITRLSIIQQSINEYCERYNKLLPIINLAQIKLGHEVEAPPTNVKLKSNPSSTNNTPNLGNKPSPMNSNPENIMNSTHNTPNSNIATPSNGSAISANINKNVKKNVKKSNTTHVNNNSNGSSLNASVNKNQGGSSSSPIVI